MINDFLEIMLNSPSIMINDFETMPNGTDMILNDWPYTEKYFQNLIKSKSDCIYHFPIYLEPNGPPFGSKSVGKW